MIKPQSTARQHNDKKCQNCWIDFIGYAGNAKWCKECRKIKDKETLLRSRIKKPIIWLNKENKSV